MPLIASEIVDIYSITDGLNTVKSGVRIGPTELKNCQNIRYRPVGGFMWRPGYTTLGTNPAQACTGLYMGRYSAGTNVLFRTRGTKLEKMDALDGVWDDITGALSLTAGQDNIFNFAILNDIVVGVNDTNTAIQISSALSASHLSTPFTSALFVAEHRGYMFYGNCVVGGTRQPGRVYFSDLNTPGTVGANNYIDVSGKTGGDARGACDYNGKLYVWKRHGIYGIEFQPTRTDSSGTLFPFIENSNPIVPGVGTQSHRSIVKFTTPATHKTPGQELVFFVDQFGVPRLFDGQTSISIGANILTSRDETITSLSNMSKSRLAYIWSVNDAANNLVYCFMSSSGSTRHDVCWVLDYNTAFAWSRDSYAKSFNTGCIVENTSGFFKPYFADYDGQVYETGSGQTDNGTAIASYARSGDFYVKSPVVQSRWLYNEMRGATGSDTQEVTIDYFTDGSDVTSKTETVILYKENQAAWNEVNWDEFNWAYSGLTTKSSEVNLEAKTLGVQFSNSTSGNTASIEGYSLFVIPEGWKQED